MCHVQSHETAAAAKLPNVNRYIPDAIEGFAWLSVLESIPLQSLMDRHYRGYARKGPTSCETVLMHAVSRLVLHSLISNIQASWVKLGPSGVRTCLAAGVNDLGGTLMNESISRAAGAEHRQERPPEAMGRLIASAARLPEQRTTLYRPVPSERRHASYHARAIYHAGAIGAAFVRVGAPYRDGASSKLTGQRQEP